jgi:uncharacterized protein with WD repeat
LTIVSCNKDSGQPLPSPGASLLLTEKPWKLRSYGYDFNKNGVIDSNEENIRACEKDNVSVFNSDGTGIVMENALICEGSEKVSHFVWSLTSDDRVIDFDYDAAFIARISKDDLIITDTTSDPVRLTVIYGH